MLEGAKSTGTTPRKKTRENQGGVDWRVGYGIKAATNIKKKDLPSALSDEGFFTAAQIPVITCHSRKKMAAVTSWPSGHK